MSKEKIIYFWKPNEAYGFLSNWHYAPFTLDDKKFINSEQYFMWSKLQLFDPTNKELENTLLTTINSSIMKNIGRNIKNFNQDIWDKNKYNIMKKALMAKFTQNKELHTLLLKTKTYKLVEASPYDKVWGIGIDKKAAMNGIKYQGENLLGKVLMEIREALINLP